MAPVAKDSGNKSKPENKLSVSYVSDVFNQIEEPIIKFWKENKIFEKSVEERPADNLYVFYDGPPFVTGTPHFGSLLPSVLKDVVPRFQTMLGKRVERRWGWDCHGLPIEEKVERKLGTKNRRDIEEKVGLENFIKECYNYVQETSAAWPWYIDHIGRWVDMENAYRTMDKDYMESVMWVFKQIYDKDLVYYGKRISLYCPRCGTPLSRFEIQMDNSYKDLEDPSIFVKFPAKYYKTGLGVGVVIENDKGQILMAKRNEPGRKEVWGIIGGKMDPEDKNLLETVVRETKEEAGVDVTDITYYGYSIDVFEGRLFKTHHFKVKIQGEPQKSSDELKEFVWVDKDKIPWDDIHIPTKNCLNDVLSGKPKAEFKDLDNLDEKNVKNLPSTDKPNVYLLVWTTTPWTLPENVAVAINKDEVYVTVKYRDEYYILAKKRLEHVFKDKEYEIVDEYKGSEVVGLSYEPLFDYFKDKATDKDFKVYATDFVSMEEGTGLVHMATAYGEDDFNARKELGLSIFEAIDDAGKFTEPVSDYKGMYFKDADPLIIDNLEKRGLLFAQGKIVHSYPICYRCGTPLLYKAQESWYVDMQKVKPAMLKNNEKINWVPEHFKEGLFKHVIETAPDWGISRTRYWATPIPIWKCEKCGALDVVGSIKEIEEKSGKKVTDLHRPYIDEHTWKCEKCGGEMKRVPEVVDVWLESGSMPYAQFHYPFENKEKFEKNFPGDFIVEYVAQVRAWFNMLHRVATIVSDSNAFKNVIVTGVIKGTDGRKMSKSFGNYPDPKGTIEKYGGEALRLFFVRSPLPVGENVNVSEEGIKDQLKEITLPYLNIYRYFATYANQHNYKPEDNLFNWDIETNTTTSDALLDSWVLARTVKAVNKIKYWLSKYYINKAAAEIRPLLDDISVWYIRRNRDRFVAGDKQALDTLFTVLMLTTLALAPFMPFSTEYVYQELVKILPKDKQLESIHLWLWPEVKKLTNEQKEILTKMQVIRELASLGHKIRVENNLPVKQPLGELIVWSTEKLTGQYTDILKDELNVLQVKLSKDKKELVELKDPYKVEEQDNLAVALNTEVTRELLKKRLAREIIRAIQVTRQKNGFKVGERAIASIYFTDEIVQEVIDEAYQQIGEKTFLNEIYTEQTSDLSMVKDTVDTDKYQEFKIGPDKLEIIVALKK